MSSFFPNTCCIFSCLRQSRHGATDVNTEPSQNEQIIWDDPTAREERARLASNLQWPNSPSQYSEQIQTTAVTPGELSLRKSLSDTDIVEMGKLQHKWQNGISAFEFQFHYHMRICS